MTLIVSDFVITADEEWQMKVSLENAAGVTECYRIANSCELVVPIGMTEVIFSATSQETGQTTSKRKLLDIKPITNPSLAETNA